MRCRSINRIINLKLCSIFPLKSVAFTMQLGEIILFLILSIETVVFSETYNTQKPCLFQKKRYGYVCMCNENYCDTLDVPDPKTDNDYVWVKSSRKKDRFAFEIGTISQYDSCCKRNKSSTTLDIDLTKQYQTIQGFGGAYTGAVAYLIGYLPTNMRNCIYNSYFSRDVGLGYTHVRIPIGGSDFDLSPWAYNEYPANDMNLSNFTQLDARDLLRNSQLKEIVQVTGLSDLKIMGCYWGPPTWMKGQQQWGGGPQNQLLPQYYQLWATYHLKWVELMDEDGIDVWAISTGNEPKSAAHIKFQALSWNARDQARWIAENLGPTMKNSKYSNCEIHGFDENRNLAPEWLSEMEKYYPAAMQYMSAFDFHAYADKAIEPQLLDFIKYKYQDKHVWYTEMSFGASFMTKLIGPRLGEWGRCEQLASILIENLCHSTVGYMDWNLILDHQGGPNYIKNFIDAQIVLSADKTEMYKQPTFYIMAHFSRFILPGSIRIETSLAGRKASSVKAIAFLRPDGKISVIIYNKEAKKSVKIIIRDKFKGAINIKLQPKSINTITYTVGKTDVSSATTCPKRKKKC